MLLHNHNQTVTTQQSQLGSCPLQGQFGSSRMVCSRGSKSGVVQGPDTNERSGLAQFVLFEPELVNWRETPTLGRSKSRVLTLHCSQMFRAPLLGNYSMFRQHALSVPQHQFNKRSRTQLIDYSTIECTDQQCGVSRRPERDQATLGIAQHGPWRGNLQ